MSFPPINLLSTPLVTALAVVILTSCAPVPLAFGPTREAASKSSSELLTGMSHRYTNVQRSPKYENAREKIGRSAMIPSQIFGDTSLWTMTASDGSRIFYAEGSFQNGNYLVTNLPTPTAAGNFNLTGPLASPGDARHFMRLKQTKREEFEWFTQVDFGVGSLTPSDGLSIINTWLRAAEGKSGTELQRQYRSDFPSTSEVMGILFMMDTIISVIDRSGANTVYIRSRITPNKVKATFPKLSDYLNEYIMRLNLRMRLTDAAGSQWFDLQLRNGVLAFKVRSKEGHFVPLEGPLKTMPEDLQLTLDLTARVKRMTVGFTKLTGKWKNIQTPSERGWSMQFTKEPSWQIPSVVKNIIRTPLRRPFMGEGVQFRITLKKNPDHNQTLLVRQGSLTVQESAILRFLGRLGGDAMGDFVAEVEKEENKFNAMVFRGLQKDFTSIFTNN